MAPPVLVSAAPADPMLNQARSALLTAGAVVGALFGVALALFLVSSIVRLVRKAKSNAAYDHLELGERRDYTEPADEELEDVEVRTEETYHAGEEEDLTVESPVRPAQDMPDPEEMPDWDGEGGYRVTRTEPKEEIKAAEAAEEAADKLQAVAEETAEKADAVVEQAAEDVQAAAEKTEAAAQDAADTAAKSSRRRRRAQRTEDGE